ncbi:unnamed protein product, partial [Iphiclides podalirius]
MVDITVDLLLEPSGSGVEVHFSSQAGRGSLRARRKWGGVPQGSSQVGRGSLRARRKLGGSLRARRKWGGAGVPQGSSPS